MIFNDNESLTSLYTGITKQVEPSTEQLTKQAPLLSNTSLSKDQQSLEEAYNVMTNSGSKKCTCMHAAKGCDCDGCDECRCNRDKVDEAKKNAKPDYMDVDEDGDKKEPMKKALKEKVKESSKFKSYFQKLMTESTVCGTKVNSQHQYNCVTKDGEEKVLKGESVIMMKDKLKSVKPAHKK